MGNVLKIDYYNRWVLKKLSSNCFKIYLIDTFPELVLFIGQSCQTLLFLQSSTLGPQYVYGEMGLRTGGPMPPHRTHENGTSVDFMVPVRGRDGRPAQLPRTAQNHFGYDLEFDDAGKLADLRIDFAAIAAHLAQLDLEARRHGFGIARVILAPEYIPKVLATPVGQNIKSLPFMKTRPWVRHDEHYHVDFAVKCAG